MKRRSFLHQAAAVVAALGVLNAPDKGDARKPVVVGHRDLEFFKLKLLDLHQAKNALVG